MNRLLFILVMDGLLLAGCSSMIPLNNAPPSYIKETVAYKEGSYGLEFYIILADATGAMTTANGTLELEITETHLYISKYGSIEERNLLLFSTRTVVSRSSFGRAKVGKGEFRHEVILFPFERKRIPYSSFSKRPSETDGKVRVTFVTEDGRSLKGEDTISF